MTPLPSKEEEVFALCVLFAKVAYALAFCLTVAAPTIAVITGNPFYLAGNLGAAGVYTAAHLNLKAAQAIACPDPVPPQL